MIANPHNYTMVSIDSVIPYPNNPRLNDDAVQGVADSLTAFGWQQPITVDKDNVVITGHTRLKAAYLLDQTEVPVQVATNLTPDEVAAYRIVDNKVSEVSVWDIDLLNEELKNIQMDMSGFGFDELEPIDFDSLFVDAEEKEKEPEEVKCPHCGMYFQL